MAKKCKCPPPEQGIAGWVVTYGDLMSLLLTFFVLLLSFSSMQEAKFKEAMASLQKALGVFTLTESLIEFEDQVEPEYDEAPAQPTAETLHEFQKMEQYLLENDLDIEVDLTMKPEGINIKIKDSLLFTSGSARLQQGGLGVLDEIFELLEENSGDVRVSGHTDSVPINTAQFASNWSLSTARAVSVVRFLIDQGIPAGRLSAAGFGEFHPLDTADTAEAYRRNRRIELKLTSR